ELYTVDQRFVIRGPRAPRPDIAIIAIDRVSLEEMRKRFTWPWPRHVYADLIDRLSRAGASVVAFDVVFDLPRAARDDNARAEPIPRSGRFVLACQYEPTVAGGNRGGDAGDQVTSLSDDERLTVLAAVQERLPRLRQPAPAWLGPLTADTF